MLRSLGFGLGLETFAKFLMISVSVSKNLVSEKKYRFRFRKIWSRKQSFGFGFGKFGIGKKVSVSVLVKILVSSFSGHMCRNTLRGLFFSLNYFSEQKAPILWLEDIVRCKHKISNRENIFEDDIHRKGSTK